MSVPKPMPICANGQFGNLNQYAYDSRGWCTFEQGAASIAAYWASRGGRVDNAECPARGADGKMSLVNVKLVDISSGEDGAAMAPRVVVPSCAPNPEALKEKINGAHFTGKGDKADVLRMLNEFNTNLHFQAVKAKRCKPSMLAMSGRGARGVPVVPARRLCAFIRAKA